MQNSSSTELATLHHYSTRFKVTNIAGGVYHPAAVHSRQLQQAVQAHSPALNIPSHPMLVQQLQSLAVSSCCKHSLLNHIFSLSCLRLHPHSSKIQALCSLKYIAKTFLHNQHTPFLCCNQSNLSHPAIVWDFLSHPVKFYPLKYRWWEYLVLPLTVPVISLFSTGYLPILLFQFRPNTGSCCCKMLILQLFQHDSLTSINSAFASLTNLRSHLIFLHFCWTGNQPPPATSVTTEMELFIA